MATDERVEQKEDGRLEMSSQTNEETVPANPGEPVAPKILSEREAQKVRSDAIELVAKIEKAVGAKELELLDGITNVGIQAQRDAGGQLDLLRARMGAFLNEGGTSAEIAKGLQDLRVTLNQINPHEMTQPGFGRGLFGALPFFNRGSPMVRALNKIALRYEPVSRQVAEIESKLRDGRALLVGDNIELRKLYEDVEAQQLPIQRNAYAGELLAQHLSELLERTEDPVKRDRIQGALHDVVTRVQDMRTTEEVHIQYFVSIEMSRQNNSRLGQAVERTLTLTTNVLTVGLAIQTALIRQKRVMEATQRTRAFLGDLVTANAASIKRHTQEVGDLFNNPVIAVEKVTQAHNDLVEALETAGRLRQEGIEAARENIASLTGMSAELTQKAAGLLERSESRPDVRPAPASGELDKSDGGGDTEVSKEVRNGSPRGESD